MSEKSPRTMSIGTATIIAAIVTGCFTFLAARQVLKVEVSLPGVEKESFSPAEAADKIEELSRRLAQADAKNVLLQENLDSQGGSEDAAPLRLRIQELERQLRSKDELIASLRSSGQTSEPEPRPTELVKEAPGIKVELLACQLSGEELKCDFRATSTDRDKTVYLRSARLIQGDSSEVWPIRMQFASSISQGSHSPTSGKQVYAQMVRGITIGGNVVFDGVNPALAAQGIPLIELKFDGLAAQFRDVQPE